MPLGWPIPPFPPANVNFSSSGNQTLVAAPTAGGIAVYGLMLVNASTSTSTVITIYQDGGTTPVASTILFNNGGSTGWVLQRSTDYKNPYFITNNATAFVINSSAAVQIYGVIYAANCP